MWKISSRKDGNAKALCHGKIHFMEKEKLQKIHLHCNVLQKKIGYFYEAAFCKYCDLVHSIYLKFFSLFSFLIIWLCKPDQILMDDPYFQYYEMSYGLNVEMHKQVKSMITSTGLLVGELRRTVFFILVVFHLWFRMRFNYWLSLVLFKLVEFGSLVWFWVWIGWVWFDLVEFDLV